jgi:hypothetical protein
MYDNRLAKIAKHRKTNIPRLPGMAFKTLARKLDINITGTLDKIQDMVF